MRSEPPHSAGPPARTYRGWSSPASPRAHLAHIQAVLPNLVQEGGAGDPENEGCLPPIARSVLQGARNVKALRGVKRDG